MTVIYDLAHSENCNIVLKFLGMFKGIKLYQQQWEYVVHMIMKTYVSDYEY